MGISITVELEPSFYTKVDVSLYREAISRTLEECGDELLDCIKEEAPVRTGRLRDGHFLQKGEGWVNIQNEAYYWKYVVYRGNDYVSRGLLQWINSQRVQDIFTEELQMVGLR